MSDHDETNCTCPEHRPLGVAARVLHDQSIGCNWHEVPTRNREHYRPVEVNGVLLAMVEVIHDAGPFPHDGWHHDGDHEAVVRALTPVVRWALDDS